MTSATHPITVVVDNVVYRLTMDALVDLQAHLRTRDEKNEALVEWLNAARDDRVRRESKPYVEH